MTDAAAIFNLKDHRLGKLVAAAISLVVTLFCLAFAFVGSAVLLREANSIEQEHDMVKSEYWVKQIAEAAFLGNMAYIEGNIRPGIEEQSQLAIFYVADPTGKIIVTSNLQFLDQDKEIASTFFSEVKSILKTHKIIREGSNLSLNIASRELKLASPLQRNAFARPVQQGDRQ